MTETERERKRESVCVCVFIIQYAKSMHRIILSNVAYLAILHFSKLSDKQLNFRENNSIEHKPCVPIFSATLE